MKKQDIINQLNHIKEVFEELQADKVSFIIDDPTDMDDFYDKDLYIEYKDTVNLYNRMTCLDDCNMGINPLENQIDKVYKHLKAIYPEIKNLSKKAMLEINDLCKYILDIIDEVLI